MNRELAQKGRRRRALRRLHAVSLPAVGDQEPAALDLRHSLSACVRRGQPRHRACRDALGSVWCAPAASASIHVQLRFLHLVSRQVADAGDEPVASVVVDGRLVETWDEGVERSVEFEVQSGWQRRLHQCSSVSPATTSRSPCEIRWARLSAVSAARSVKSAARCRSALCRSATVFSSSPIDVTNTTPLPTDSVDRNSALLRSLLSAHTILTVTGGEFVSLLDPPDELRERRRWLQ